MILSSLRIVLNERVSVLNLPPATPCGKPIKTKKATGLSSGGLLMLGDFPFLLRDPFHRKATGHATWVNRLLRSRSQRKRHGHMGHGYRRKPAYGSASFARRGMIGLAELVTLHRFGVLSFGFFRA
jgi:hypothetical protein